MSLHRGSRKRRASHQVTKAIVEVLEERRLLTTIHGGESLEFNGPTAGTLYRVVVDGPSSAQFDLIGATFNPDPNAPNGQTATLNDIPAAITRANGTVVDELGGIGGADGVEPVSDITGAAESRTDLIGGPVPLQAPSGGININALSSTSTGKTWGLNVIQLQTGGAARTDVELVSIDYRGNADATVEDDLAPGIVAATPGATITTNIVSITAADFLPSNDNLLYFSAVVTVPRTAALTPGGTPAGAPIPFLYTYDFTQPNPANRVHLVGEFVSDPANFGASDVAPTLQGFSLTSTGRLVAMVTGRSINGFGSNRAIQTAVGLIDVDPTNPVFSLNQITPITLDNTAITDFHSLEVIPGDDDFVYGINGTGTASILLHVKRVNPGAGQAVNFGPLPDPDDNSAAPRGSNLGDLAWNPALQNNFNGKKGVLIAEDTTTDELVAVDSRERFPTTNLYSIFGTNTTSDTSISIAEVPALTVTPRPMEPFTGTAGPIQVVAANGGPDITVTPDGGTGSLFVGARTRDLIPNTAIEENRPIRRIVKKPSQVFGNLPKSTKYVYAGINIQGDIDNVLIGGTVTGNVFVAGSANLLYAGDWLTGDAEGRSKGAANQDLASNVLINGDVRTIATVSTFGSTSDDNGVSPSFLSGFSLAVGGKLGQLRALSSYVGDAVYVSNTAPGNGAAMQEVEDRRGTPTGSATYFEGFNGGVPSLGDNPSFNNDTFATPQYLSTGLNRALGSDEVAVVDGSVGTNGDSIDYYALSLLAGQTATVQLSIQGSGNVQIFDPDNRMINSDETNDTNQQSVAGRPFVFTADRPGAYRFAVTGSGDYTLRITNVADIALGGVVCGVNIVTTNGNFAPFRVHTGDAGAFEADGQILDTSTAAYTVDRGNLRSVESPSVGRGTVTNGVTTVSDGINLTVPRGSVGLLRATGTDATTQVLMVNFNKAMIDPSTGLPDPTSAIGGDYQLVEARGEYEAFLSADRSIGTVRAAQMTVTTPPFLIANADRRGSDGVIDLIDVAGQMGTLSGGGPHIYTGPGGNVRYMRAGGTVFNSSKFGGTPDNPSVLTAGSTLKLTDDSGTPMKLTPTPLVPNFNFNGTTDPNKFLSPGGLSVLTYQTDDPTKAGVVVMNVTVTDPTGTGANYGLNVDSGGTGKGSVEIGTIALSSVGRTFVETPDPVTLLPTLAVQPRNDDLVITSTPSNLTPLDITLTGSNTVDVYSITAPGNIDMINNETPDGELVNVTAQGVGDMAAAWIGIAKSHTGADPGHSGNAVNGVNILADQGSATASATVLTPFIQQRNLIHISGGASPALITAHARKGIGNIWVEGIIGNIVADSNHHKDASGGFEGIDAPIVASPSAVPFGGRIQSIDIGKGVLPTGRGNVAFSGIFASDTITLIKGDASGDDIRGVIRAGGTTAGATDSQSIGAINLKGGSLIGANVGVTESFIDWRTDNNGITIPQTTNDPANPRFDIGSINLKGTGGIIGSIIIGPDIGPININGGFGFLNSIVSSVSDSRITGINTTGYGIRASTITGGQDVTQLIASGTGNKLNVNSFESSVLLAGSVKVDPFFGTAPNASTDLYKFLGLSPAVPIKKSISASGVIENTSAVGGRDLDKVVAYQIRGKGGGRSNFDFSNQIGTVSVLDGTDEVEFTGGGLKSLSIGADAYNTDIGVSGAIKTLRVGGTLRGSSSVSATGPEGTISSLSTGRGLFATVFSTIGISSINVGTFLGSPQVTTSGNLDLLQVNGSIVAGTLVGSVTKGKGIKTLGDLEVTGNIEAGSTVRAKSIKKQHIGGVINGNIIIG